jgi:acyl carrier protein
MNPITEQQISNDLIAFIKDQILDSGLNIDKDTLFANAGLDSMSIIQLILFIERKYGLAIPDTHLLPENLASVAALSKCCYLLLHP